MGPVPPLRRPRELLKASPEVLCRFFARPVGWWPRACTATIVLLRHADPVTGPDPDPGLSSAGLARRDALVHVLESMAVDAVFHSQARRTRETAEAVAAAAGVVPEEIHSANLDHLLSRLRGQPRRSTSVVVGHSNTVPQLIERLGGGTVPSIDLTEFDNLYVVDRAGARPTHHLHYGART